MFSSSIADNWNLLMTSEGAQLYTQEIEKKYVWNFFLDPDSPIFQMSMDSELSGVHYHRSCGWERWWGAVLGCQEWLMARPEYPSDSGLVDDWSGLECN